MRLGRRKPSPVADSVLKRGKAARPRKPRSPRIPFRQKMKIVAQWLFAVRWRLLIIERYVFGEVWTHFLLGVLGFTFFMIITSLFTLGDKIFGKHIPPFTVMKILLLSTPAYLILAIPVACLFATLMAMGRLSRDNELTAMYTTGVSLYRIFLPFLALGFFAGVLSYSVYEYVVPPNNREFKNTLAVFWESQVVDFIKPRMVIKAPERKYFYIDSVNKETGIMSGIRLYDYGEGRSFPRIFLADDARMEEGYLVLNNVRVYEPQERNGASMVSAATPNTKVDIARKIREFYAEEAPQELSTTNLRIRIDEERRAMQAQQQVSRISKLKFFTDYTEYYFKFALPFASIVLVLVAVPISIRGPREERNMALILSFLLVMAYYALFFACRTLGYLGYLPSMFAGWLPNSFFAVASVLLFVRARK
jgi:LPS export ABC transporter permease LptF